MTLEDGQRPSASILDGKLPVPPTEAEETLTAQEYYLHRLYDESLRWLTQDLGGQVIAQFNQDNVLDWGLRIKRELLGDDFKDGIIDGEDFVFPQVDNWDTGAGRHGHPMDLSIDLEKGVIISSGDHDYGLVLGRRYVGRDGRVLSFQFGVVPKGQHFIDPDLGGLYLIAGGHYMRRGTGEFTINDMTGRIDIRSWADDLIEAGGDELKSWKPSELQSGEGFAASMELIKAHMTITFRPTSNPQASAAV